MRSFAVALIAASAVAAVAAGCASTKSTAPEAAVAPTEVAAPAEAAHPLQALRDEAAALATFFESGAARAMLAQVEHLPVLPPKVIHIQFRPNRAFTQAEFDALPEAEREGLSALEVDPMRYYSTLYGSPLVYARVLDLASAASGGELDLRGARVVDLGYGQLGQLRLWAQMGADVTGVEVDHLQRALYADCAAVGDVDGDPATPGSVRLVDGQWPSDPAIRDAVGGGIDLLVARNLLKRGYVKPAKPDPDYPAVGAGMSDEQILGAFHDALAPGGLVVIVSLGGAPNPANPATDIANPWTREQWEAAGFDLIAHDADETQSARAMGRALGWEAFMDLEAGLFGVHSVYRRRE